MGGGGGSTITMTPLWKIAQRLGVMTANVCGLMAIAASSLSDPDSKENLRFFEEGWGGGLACGFASGGCGAVVVDAHPPSSPSLPPQALNPSPPPPPRKHHLLHLSPLAGPVVTRRRRSPHSRSLSHADLAREQGPRVGLGPRCGGGTPGVLPGILQRLAGPPGSARHASR